MEQAAVQSGRLLFPSSPALVNKITKKKPWTPKYCILFKASKQGIERLEIYENEEDAAGGECQKIITLENCIKITRGATNNITIVTKSLTQQVTAPTEAEASEWVTALQTVAFGDDTSKQVSIDEDNDLYCSSGEGIFSVKMCPSEASKRSGFEPIKYTLSIASTAIELRNAIDNKLCATWPYRYIRRYGYRQGKFAFEAGRKCETGEGTFHFEHSNQQEIFRCLSMKIKSMKKMMNTDSLHSLDCGDQLHAAMSMEARSRSPLPPSSKTEDFSINSISIKSSMNQSIDSLAPLLPAKPEIKQKPAKPPRKHIFSVAKEKHENDFVSDGSDFGKYRKLDNYDQVSTSKQPSFPVSYDKVEVRNEAWKTLGITDIDHTEFSSENTQNCLRLISRSQDNLDSTGTGESSKVIILQTPNMDPDEANYDRLQHFRSTTKLNRSEGYKSVIARPLAPITNNNNNNNISSTKDTWSDYDEVENVMQSVRLADDSYLGYGMIRKPSIPGPQVPSKTKSTTCAIDCDDDDDNSAYSNIGHCEFNGSDYAIVSKPKRV